MGLLKYWCKYTFVYCYLTKLYVCMYIYKYSIFIFLMHIPFSCSLSLVYLFTGCFVEQHCTYRHRAAVPESKTHLAEKTDSDVSVLPKCW